MALTPNGRVGDASPLGKGPRRLSDYERMIAHALMRKGTPESKAIAIARGLLKKAAATGRWGDHGKAGAKTRAGAAASIAQRRDFAMDALTDILLAYDPAEPRDTHGEWATHPGLPGIADLPEAAKKRPPKGRTPVKAADGKKPKAATKAKADPYASLEQGRAQAAASKAYFRSADTNLMDNPDSLLDLPPSPERAWAAYQMVGGYQMMNRQLRFGDGVCSLPLTGPDHLPAKAEDEVTQMLAAFDKMGYTTKADATFYRVVAAYPGDDDKGGAGGLDPATMKVGDTFTDKGVISTSAQPDEVAGFLDDSVNPDDQCALFSIKVPAGTRVLGGSTGGIETMLHPGSTFKVTGKTRKTIGGYGTAGYGMSIGKHTLTTIEMELQP
jgi:hypothetical protein